MTLVPFSQLRPSNPFLFGAAVGTEATEAHFFTQEVPSPATESDAQVSSLIILIKINIEYYSTPVRGNQEAGRMPF